MKKKLALFWKRLKRDKGLVLLALPGVVLLFIFSYMPMFGIALPFFDYNAREGLLGSEFVGFENFRFLFENKDFLHITWNTISYNLVFTFLTPVLAIILALMLIRMKPAFVKTYQTCMFLPYFVSWVVVSYVVFGFLNMEHGLLNTAIVNAGGEAVMWYNKPEPWPYIVVLSHLWKNAGYSCIIYYTALLGVDKQLYEAAELDGANRRQQTFHISIPMITSVICMLMILDIGKMFTGNFDLFYNLARNSSQTYATMDILDTYVYRALRQIGDVGMSSAACLYQAVVGFFLVVISNWVVKKINPDYAIF